VYYVGLLAGPNDHAAVVSTGEGRSINRHDYTMAEIEEALARPVVRRQMELLAIRASHPAFAGELTVDVPSPGMLRLARDAGSHRIGLVVDLSSGRFDLDA
jgi:sucrose phosphorylase